MDDFIRITTPIADWVLITCLALCPLLAGSYYAQYKEDAAVIAAQRANIKFLEKFLINCLSGRTMVVGGAKGSGVTCIAL